MPDFAPFNPHVGAEVLGVDLTRPLNDSIFEAIENAFHRHSVLLFRDQPLDDGLQIAFARRFGRLERTRLGAMGEGSELVILTNLDADGATVPGDSKQLFDARANQLWHSDASFRPVPAYASILSARLIPTEGGETEFASTRVALTTLDASTRARLQGLEAIHHFAHSRAQIERGRLPRAESDHLPPVRHPLVRRHSATGEPALFVGSHVREVIGLSPDEGRALVDSLIAHATRDEYVYTHRWRANDLIMWDNSAVLHRGRPWDSSQARYMARATVADDGYTAGVLVAA